MNLYEIYIINRALDGEDIFSLPSFATLQINDLIADTVKEGMIAKGILESPHAFTAFGVRMTNRLSQFKNAKKHISIGSVSIGILNANEGVLLFRNQYLNEYEIQMIEITQCVEQIVKAYPFLTSVNNIADVGEESMGLPEGDIVKKYRLTPQNSFRLMSEGENRDATEELYFSSHNNLYVYECAQQILHIQDLDSILMRIGERMMV